ncbi:cytochrome P450 [Streptomyces flavofungini]|uniref:cytochrome P450 n=1 Tax=Streptomyces flavofungini TaxID=68200 RepID=UPI0025B0C880|nr:cytochrome P450 [Streptomyces flavofungini]WJV50618.1 cytochrome P450 [Streptomyces flavofungini]
MSSQPFTTGTVPGALPGLGHIWPLMRRPIEFLTSLPDHGDLVEIRLGPTPVYVPCHPELLRQTLTDDRTFDKGGKYYDRARAMAGNGVATCAHKDHRRQRRLLQPAFHPSRLEAYATTMEQEVKALTDSWGDAEVVDAYPVLYALALRTVTRTLFSTRVTDEVVADIQRSFDIAFSGFFRQMFMPPALLRLPLPANLRHQRALRNLNAIVDRVLRDATAGQESVPGQDREAAGRNVLSVLLASRESAAPAGTADTGAEGAAQGGDAAGAADAEIHDQVVTVLAAGSETVASTLTWALYLLSRNPAAQRRLQEEADTVLGGRPARWDDLPHLPHTHRVITETIRLYPPGWLFTRVTTKAVILAGRHLKAGTTVVISPVPVHRNTAVFRRAADFDPDRWLPERTSALPRGAFAGFGTGPRKCVGDGFGVAECALALTAVASHWTVRCAPGADTRPVPLAAFYRPRRLRLELNRRRHDA